MSYPAFKNKIINIAVIFIFLIVGVFVFLPQKTFAAQYLKPGENLKPEKPTIAPTKKKNAAALLLEKKLSQMQILARDYRQEGLRLQRSGDTEGAKQNYQKAIVTDPYYAPAYNDLGVTYEIEGDLESAEECYRRAIQIDPGYLSPYSNMALLLEYRRDLKTAESFWEKRAQLGLPEDPWTQKAFQRLNDIRHVLGEKIDAFRERQILKLVGDVSDRKAVIREDDTAAAGMYFQKAKTLYKRGDAVTALKEAINAMQLNPDNDEIIGFVEKVQLRLLSK